MFEAKTHYKYMIIVIPTIFLSVKSPIKPLLKKIFPIWLINKQNLDAYKYL